ncbi:MAG TPA: hypothetical protein VGS06_42850 [Streptosporangiaceae bacterium]|nr:hypothetical protein [Streptosporangiaceae bacterium]
MPEAEPARERDDALRQKELSLPIEGGRHGKYRPPTAHGDAVAAIGPELAAARVESAYPPRVAYDVPTEIKRQYAVVAAVQVHEFA